MSPGKTEGKLRASNKLLGILTVETLYLLVMNNKNNNK